LFEDINNGNITAGFTQFKPQDQTLSKIQKVILSALVMAMTLISCTSTDEARIKAAISSKDPKAQLKEYLKDKGKQYQQVPEQLVKDIKTIKQLFTDLESVVGAIWGGKNVQLPSKKKYVKYTNGYQSKAEVDFDRGLITVETIATDKPLVQLKKAIITTLLTNDNPANTDIFSDESPTLGGQPYLLGQVVDQDNKPIAYQWRANRFADHLIKSQLKKQKVGSHQGHYVEITMVTEHVNMRKQKYAEHVFASANKYQIKPDLIYAIVETESSFNPFAVSRANAYGLMQIVPATAGKDVYQKIYKREGVPTQQTLFSPKDNIDIGTAYLHILQSSYLKKITNPQSRHFAMISAYNGGAGNVYKTFSADRNKAPAVINKLSASRVYDKLTQSHPRAESRRYLQKVVKAQKHYL
jgi:membrane-bound lytic murein transglycosylase C